MKTYQIQLLEPEAERLLQELARLKLIRFEELPGTKQLFSQLLTEFRKGVDIPTDIEEDLAKEVEMLREKRYRHENKSDS